MAVAVSEVVVAAVVALEDEHVCLCARVHAFAALLSSLLQLPSLPPKLLFSSPPPSVLFCFVAWFCGDVPTPATFDPMVLLMPPAAVFLLLSVFSFSLFVFVLLVEPLGRFVWTRYCFGWLAFRCGGFWLPAELCRPPLL